ncbi:hypothetical protein PoB_001448900 [Plakobranchus ocellatus]|uniref:Uncharacterized protein n=1 Tax=Plakobranchus ocellatus TaxID=259542 RepID=A0AAV3Z1P0_9GAST|nr:hypothetical protein PoB_001448900 [Plakobranchus ocellatus]
MTTEITFSPPADWVRAESAGSLIQSKWPYSGTLMAPAKACCPFTLAGDGAKGIITSAVGLSGQDHGAASSPGSPENALSLREERHGSSSVFLQWENIG